MGEKNDDILRIFPPFFKVVSTVNQWLEGDFMSECIKLSLTVFSETSADEDVDAFVHDGSDISVRL